MRTFPPPDLSDGPIRLRPPTEEDVPAITAACQDPEIPRWTLVPTPYGDDDAREWIARTRESWASGRGPELLIVDRSTGELLGSVALTRAPHDRAVGEIGYWVSRGVRGRGVATGATRLLVRWGFDALGFARIQLFADVENVRSQRVAERAGFTREGVLRRYVALHGRRRDYVVFSLLPSDVGMEQPTLADGE